MARKKKKIYLLSISDKERKDIRKNYRAFMIKHGRGVELDIFHKENYDKNQEDKD